MADSRTSGRNRAGGGVTLDREDWKHLARVGSLAAVVLGALVMGALLQFERPGSEKTLVAERATASEAGASGDAPSLRDSESTISANPATPPEASSVTSPAGSPGATPATEAAAAPTAEGRGARAEQNDPTTPFRPADLDALAGRVGRDLERLADARGAWLLQVAAHCDPANVQRALHDVSGERLHVLPVEIGERACFRLCWGPFDSRDSALAASDRLPRPLRTGDRPRPRAVADLIQ